jgi:hypothetical protein
MGIKMIDSSSNNPSSRGKAERAVQQVKTILRKMLVNASSKTLNWEYLTLLISKVMNQSITPRTGFTPIEMIVGKGGLSKSFLDLPALMPPHHLVKDKQEEIKIKTEEIKKMSEIAISALQNIREKVHDNLNKNRTDKKRDFKESDIVFAIDRYVLPGNSRPLKSKFFPSPYVVIQARYTTCLIERLADKFRTLISNDDIKLFKNIEIFTEEIPEEIRQIFSYEFPELLPEDLAKITKFDPLKIPQGINLTDPNISISLESDNESDIESEEEIELMNTKNDIKSVPKNDKNNNDIKKSANAHVNIHKNIGAKIKISKNMNPRGISKSANIKSKIKVSNTKNLPTIVEEKDKIENIDVKILRSGKEYK